MLTLVTAPTSEPVELADVKKHLGIEQTLDDERLTAYIAAAVDLIENETNRSFIATTWKETLHTFPSVIRLKKSPLSSFTSLKYYDPDNSQQTWSSSNYYVISSTNQPAEIQPVDAWPNIYDRPDAIELEYVAAYATVPTQLVHAVKMLVGHWNENREAIATGTIVANVPLGVEHLIQQLRYQGYK